MKCDEGMTCIFDYRVRIHQIHLHICFFRSQESCINLYKTTNGHKVAPSPFLSAKSDCHSELPRVCPLQLAVGYLAGGRRCFDVVLPVSAIYFVPQFYKCSN